MKVKFSKNLKYQLDAINAIVEFFEGGGMNGGGLADKLGINADFKLSAWKDLSNLK